MEIGVVSLFIGQKLLTDTISSTTHNIYTILGRPSFNMYSFDKIINQLDLTYKLKTIEAVLKEICNIEIDSDALKLTIESVHEMITYIHDDLHKIEKIILDHKNKWFSGYRSIDMESEVIDLRLHTQLLDSRYDLLLKTLSITRKKGCL